MYLAAKINVCLHLYFFRTFSFIAGVGMSWELIFGQKRFAKNFVFSQAKHSILDSNKLNFSAETKYR